MWPTKVKKVYRLFTKTDWLTRQLQSSVAGGIAHTRWGVSSIGHVRLGALSLPMNHSQTQTQTLCVRLRSRGIENKRDNMLRDNKHKLPCIYTSSCPDSWIMWSDRTHCSAYQVLTQPARYVSLPTFSLLYVLYVLQIPRSICQKHLLLTQIVDVEMES